MEDFSFLGAGRARPGRAAPPPLQPQPAQVTPQLRTPIAIPSVSEVQAANQQATGAMNSLFKPRGLMTAQGPHQAQHQPQQHQQQHQQQQQPPLRSGHNGLQPASRYDGNPGAAFVDGGNHAEPPFQHQYHQLHQTYPQQQPQQPQQQQQGGGQQQAGLATSGNAIVVSRRQQGNPVLKHIKNVRWVFGDIGPDYLLGANACALFLSLRYHLLHPNYILYRIKELQRAFALRVVMVHVDVEDVVHPLAEITKAAALNDCTLICAWSAEEAARYLETFKAYENKPSAAIQERVDGDYASRLASTLTAVRAVNRTDALALGAQLGTLADVMQAFPQQLSACPGIGPTKVQNLWDAFNKPFRRQLVALGPAPALTAAGRSGLGPSVEAAPAGTEGTAITEDSQADVMAPQQGAVGQQQLRAAGHISMDALPVSDLPDQTAHDSGRDIDLTDQGEAEGQAATDNEDEMDEDEGTWDDDGFGGAEGGGGDLVHMASQIMLQVQAGAMAAGAVDSEVDEDEEAEEL